MQKKKGLSIRIKLIGVVIPIVLILIVSFFVLSRNVVIKISQEKLQAKSQGYAEEISAWTTKIFAELQIYQNAIEDNVFADDNAILKYLETSLNKNEAYSSGLYMGDDSGVYLDGSGWVPEGDWVLVEREWYVDGKDNDTFAFGEPYYDSMTGQVCVSASVRVDYAPAVRVLATDVYLDYVVGLVSDISTKKGDSAFLVTKGTQTIIADANEEMLAVTLGTPGIGSLYTEVGKALAADQSGIIPLDVDGSNYYVCINPIKNIDWYLISYEKEEKVLSDMIQMESIMLIIGVLAAAVLSIAILHIVNGIVRPVKHMTTAIDRIAEGDFSQDISSKGNDEIARMSNNMQLFISQMRGTISEISNIAGLLERQSEENGEVSNSLKTSSQKQEAEMELLGNMVKQLSRAAEDALKQMDNLAALIQQANVEGKEADVLIRESVELSQNGKNDMEQVNKGMTNINDSIKVLSAQFDKVNHIVSQIGDMVDMIVDIADETNLLSLNASIEAARAGEAGRGFAVVAEQIGSLAANSSSAADKISGLTAQIHTTVTEAMAHMNASVTEVATNVEVVGEASATFDSLYKKIDETNQRVLQMIELVGKVDGVSGHMKEISKSQAQATEQISQSAEEMSLHMKNVAKDSCIVAENAEELKKESVELMKRIGQFKV